MPQENLAARLIRREGAGLIVDPADIEGFVSAVLGMLENPTMLVPMGPNGRAYAERAFAISPIADRFEAIMATIRN